MNGRSVTWPDTTSASASAYKDGTAAPAAERLRVERHQVRKPDLRLVHREADDPERRGRHEQAPRQLLPGARAAHLEDLPARAAFGQEALLDRAAVHFTRVEPPVHAERRQPFQLRRIDVDDGHRRPARLRDLHAVGADAAGADDDDKVAGGDRGALERLIGRCHRVGDDGEIGEVVAAAIGPEQHEVTCRQDDIGGEPAVRVVARHDLVLARVVMTGAAQLAGVARDHRRDDDVAADQMRMGRSRVDDRAGDLVAEDEGQGVARADLAGVEADVGVADAATGDPHPHIVETQRWCVEGLQRQFAWRRKDEPR